MNRSEEDNKRLCEAYPFLIPFSRWSGQLITSKQKGYWPGDSDDIPEYNYEYTELDSMPNGWRIAFGEQMCEEIKQALLEEGGEEALREWRIDLIRQRFGSLRWYSNGDRAIDHIQSIIDKYEKLSYYTCVKCGKPATKISKGWTMPFCDDCAKGRQDTDY